MWNIDLYGNDDQNNGRIKKYLQTFSGELEYVNISYTNGFFLENLQKLAYSNFSWIPSLSDIQVSQRIGREPISFMGSVRFISVDTTEYDREYRNRIKYLLKLIIEKNVNNFLMENMINEKRKRKLSGFIYLEDNIQNLANIILLKYHEIKKQICDIVKAGEYTLERATERKRIKKYMIREVLDEMLYDPRNKWQFYLKLNDGCEKDGMIII